MKMNYKNIACEVKARSGFSAEAGELCADAVAYAVCRLFAKSESLCCEYVTESYCMRIANGKGKKSRRHKCIVPAFLAEIDGELLQIDFTVDSMGVTIQNVREISFARE